MPRRAPNVHSADISRLARCPSPPQPSRSFSTFEPSAFAFERMRSVAPPAAQVEGFVIRRPLRRVEGPSTGAIWRRPRPSAPTMKPLLAPLDKGKLRAVVRPIPCTHGPGGGQLNFMAPSRSDTQSSSVTPSLLSTPRNFMYITCFPSREMGGWVAFSETMSTDSLL